MTRWIRARSSFTLRVPMNKRLALAPLALFASALLAAACTGGSGGDPTPTPTATPTATPTGTPVTTVATVGTDGGQVTTESGVVVDVPAGAIGSAQTITITESAEPASEPGALSPVYSFEPHGIVFAQPVTVSLPLPAGAPANATVFWSKHGEPGFEDVGGTSDGTKITTKVVHFSEAFVAEPSGSRAVSGSKIVTWVTPSGIVNVPIDLTSLTVAALVIDSSGNVTTHSGVGRADGTFAISGVPYGTYYLRVGSDFVVTSESAIDLGYVRLGRPDKIPASPSTSLTFDVTNLAPWQDGDSLEFFSTGADTWWFSTELDVPVAVGSTALMGYTIDAALGANSGPVSLIDGSKGDRGTLAQLEGRQSTEGMPYQAMSRIFEPASFTQTDGGNTVLTGSFTDVSLTKSVSFDARISQFVPLVTQVNPNATTQFRFVGVLGQPGGLDHGAFSASADFLLVYPGTADFVASNMSYGTPLAGAWGEYASISFYNLVPYQVGSAASRNFRANIFQSDTVTAMSAAPIVPKISPVRNAKVGALDLSAAQSGVGTSPLLSWEPPTIGTPDVYSVTVYRAYDNAGATAFELKATFRTSATSVRLPSGILATGEQYFVRISAIDSTIPVAAPYRTSIPIASAPFASALFTP